MSSYSLANVYLQILQTHGEDLIAVLKNHVGELPTYLVKATVISPTVKDRFDSLDCSQLDLELVARYLLKLIRDEVRSEPRVFCNFLLILSKVKGGIEMFKVLGKELDKLTKSMDEADCKEENGVDGSETYFNTDEHVNILTNMLAKVSHKWEEIAIALNLPKHVRENSRSGSNIISLNKVLDSWVALGEATLVHLKAALESEVVNQKTVAVDLDKKFRPASPYVEQLSVSEILRSQFPCHITYQSSSTMVSDGKSTLLEVQASHHGSVSYQWMKDDQPLVNCSTYSGVHSDILFINNVGKREEGSYFCCVRDSDIEVCSNKMKLSVKYSPAKEYILNLYSKYKDIPPDSWPQGSNTYINLKLSKSSKLCTEAISYARQGSAYDSVAGEEDQITLEVFRMYQSGSLILIEGRPGSGKSTLIQKIVIDWSNGDMLMGANMVYLIPLRYNNLGGSDESLSSLLNQFYYSEKAKLLTENVDKMEKSGGEKICFVIDGFDEYCLKDEKQSIIHKLIWKTYLPQAMIIVSSRPSATAIIKQNSKITECIEVMGFAKEDIFDYIEKFPFSGTGSEELKIYLQTHSNVLDMCYLPVHSAIICSLYKEHKESYGDIPNTETKIYELFIKLIIQHHFNQKKTRISFDSLHDLREKDKNFESLCYHAFNMKANSKHAFRDTDIPGGFDKAMSFGLLAIDRIVALTKFEDVSAFLHVTIQEFLAALYIAHLKCAEQLKIILKYKDKPNMFNVWKFFCGLANLTSSQFKNLLSCFVFSVDENDKFLASIQYVFESQQPDLYHTLLELSGNGMSFQSRLKPSHINAVCGIISTSDCSPSDICLYS